MLRLLTISLTMLGVAAFANAASAQDPSDVPVDVKRIALVVGNADYRNEEKLPGSLVDADSVVLALRKLGFEVVEARNVVTRAQFVHDILVPFQARVEPNSLVLFFFSGHGFSFNGESYLTPLDFPKITPYRDVTSTFVSVTAVRDFIGEKRPAAAVLILDACRNMANIIDTTGDKTGRAQSKGLLAPPSAAPDTLIWFSSELGAVSYASPHGTTSFYSTALVKHIPTQDQQIDLVRKKIRAEVMQATSGGQVPWSSESSSSEIWLNPTNQTLSTLRDLWMAAKGTRAKVIDFLALYGVTPFGSAARRWLEANPVDPPLLGSAISAAAPERIWNEIAEGRSGSVGMSGPAAGIPNTQALEPYGKLAMPRNLDWQEYVARRKTLATGPGEARPGTIKEAFERQGSVITRDIVEAWRSPAMVGEAVSLPRGSKLDVNIPTMGDGPASDWLSVTTPEHDEKLYVRLSNQVNGRDIGAPTLEVVAPLPTSGPSATVDASFIASTLATVKNQGKTISWVSIATPTTSDATLKRIHSLRAAYAERLLRQQGIPDELITIVEGAALGAPNLRLRFFGR